MKSLIQAINEWTMSSKTIEKYKQDCYENSINIQLISKIHNKPLFDKQLKNIYSYNIQVYVIEWLNTLIESSKYMNDLITHIEQTSKEDGKYIHATKEYSCPIGVLNAMGIVNNKEVVKWISEYDYKNRFNNYKILLKNIIEVDSFLYDNLHNYDKLECDNACEIFHARVNNPMIHDASCITCKDDSIFFKITFISKNLISEYEDEINEIVKKSTEHFKPEIRKWTNGNVSIDFYIKK